MSISINATASAVDPSTYQASFKQRGQDFKALDSALQSGDLSSATTAFAALQKDIQGGSAKGPGGKMFASGTQASKDLAAVQTALSSGDVAGAQKAFATLKTDMKAARGAHHGHHAGGAGAAGGADPDHDGDSGVQGAAAPQTSANQTVGTLLNTQA